VRNNKLSSKSLLVGCLNCSLIVLNCDLSKFKLKSLFRELDLLRKLDSFREFNSFCEFNSFREFNFFCSKSLLDLESIGGHSG